MKPEFQPGDILAFSGTSCVSRGIQVCTLGPISHVGILANSPEGTMRLYEALLVGGVCRYHPYRSIERTHLLGGRVWHYPLANPLVPYLSSMESTGGLTNTLEAQLGKPYDTKGAMWARSLGFGWLAHLLKNREALGNLFCSELVAMALRQVCRFNTRNASMWNPTHLCRTLRRRRVVGKPVLIRRPGK